MYSRRSVILILKRDSASSASKTRGLKNWKWIVYTCSVYEHIPALHMRLIFKRDRCVCIVNSSGGWTKSHTHKSLTWKSVNGPHRYLFVGAIHKRVATFYEKGCTERYLPLLEDTFQVRRARLLADVPDVELIHFVVYGKGRPCCRGAALYRVARMGSVLERENRTVAQRRVWECSPNHSKLLRYLMDEIAAVVARTRVCSWFKGAELFIPSPLRSKGREENRESFFILWRCY